MLTAGNATSLDATALLFLPRGTAAHWTSAGSSLHIEFDATHPTTRDVVAGLLTARAQTDPRWREAMPHFDDGGDDLWTLVKALAQEVAANPSVALQEAMQAIHLDDIQRLVCIPDGHFDSLDRLPSIGPETRLQRRIGTPCHVSVTGDLAHVIFPANRVSGPLSIEPALRFVAASTEPFTVSDLPALSAASQGVLARTLVREGLLRLA